MSRSSLARRRRRRQRQQLLIRIRWPSYAAAGWTFRCAARPAGNFTTPLERYADGLKEGHHVVRGQALGFVGTSGNAPKDTPHLHFAIFRLGPEKQWWKGIALNPYPVLARQ